MSITSATVETMSPKLAATLWRMLALRDDYPAGICAAWMDGPERTCERPEDPATPRLCARHAKVALARAQRELARAAVQTMSPERRAMISDRLAANTASLADTVAQLDKLTAGPAGPLDHGILNTPLRGRGITDAQLDRYRALSARRDDLESRVALDTARLRTGRG